MIGAACSREEGRTVAALAVDEADESDALSSDMLKADEVRFLHDVCVSVVVWLGVHVLWIFSSGLQVTVHVHS